METQTFTVRAMPANGHERRWCAQRPFTKMPIDVVVKDDPAPNKMGKRQDGRAFVEEYSYEVTPSQIEEMKTDPHLAVSIKGSPDADANALNELKAKVQELEAKLILAKRDHQNDVEDHKAFRVGAEKMIEESGAKLLLLEQEANTLRERLQSRTRK